MAEDFLIRLQHFLRHLFAVNILRLKMNKLLFTFTGQQFHRSVTARKLFIFITIENQVRRGIQEGAQEGGLLFQLNLRLFTLFHLNFQLLKRRFTFRFRLFTFADFLIKLGDVVLKLHIQLEIAFAHLLQFLHQPREALPGLFQLLNHHRQEIDRPRGNQQAKEDGADHINTFHLAVQHHRHGHLHNDRQHHQRKGQQH